MTLKGLNQFGDMNAECHPEAADLSCDHSGKK